MNKPRTIRERIKMLDQRLVAAAAYITRNVNLRSTGWLILSDWKGKSGHPLWMKNHMMPSTKKAISRNVRALERVEIKSKERRLGKLRRTEVGDLG